MTLKVKFIGSFRGVSGRSGLALDLEESVSVRNLIDQIIDQLPKAKGVLTDVVSGRPRTNMLVIVNGREISVLDGMETIVHDDDEVVFVPVTHGG